MRVPRRLLQFSFYLFISAIILSRAVSSGINHDENQFLASGQLLVERGLLPYRDYPYTHMPYAIPFYALSASVSQFDYLAARLLGAITWLGCIGLLVAIFRLIDRRLARPVSDHLSWASLLGELALIAVFVNYPLSRFLQGAALNHMLATFFALLALMMFIRGTTSATTLQSSALWSGIFVSIAGFMRFNYASLVPVVLLLWLLCAIALTQSLLRVLAAFAGGAVLGALPVAVLAVLAPAQFYYGNIVYIQLNTLYYRGIRWGEAMDLASKIGMFVRDAVANPAGVVIYAAAIVAIIFYVVRLAKQRPSAEELIALGASAFAGALLLTAFTPTPSQSQYFFAPIPFLLVLVALPAWRLRAGSPAVYYLASVLAAVTMLIGVGGPNPVQELRELRQPEDWPPLQIHAFAVSLSSQEHVPPGPVLAILPMVPSEGGYASYPFTATGPFSWRTSLLLSAPRRAEYGVISPDELGKLLESDPPVAILTGLEPPKAGFTYRDQGGLERPFAEYAARHGYSSTSIYAGFLGHAVTLWVRQPVLIPAQP